MAKTKFQTAHLVKYGLKITARHANSSTVSSVMCRFCVAFGREVNPGRKRKATDNVKYFSTFVTAHYASHLSGQHGKKWKEYQALQTDEEKNDFFDDVDVPFCNTLVSHFDGDNTTRFYINASIVENVIGDLLFHPDDIEGITRARALTLFKLVEHAEPNGVPAGGSLSRNEYVAEIKTSRRFNLLVKLIGCGASFRMAARMMKCVREESGIAMFGGCSDVVASSYIRVVCAASLQILSDSLSKIWAFSIAFDGSTHQGMSYLDVRVRFVVKSVLYNFHLMAIPLFERHTGAAMFDTLGKFLDSVVASWKGSTISVSSDGAASMTGRISGLATRIQQVCEPGMIRVWCGLHQLDLVMQRVYSSALDEQFHSTLTGLIGHLRRQQNLVTEMRTTCPKVAETRWLSMSSVAEWLTKHHVRVKQHLDEKKPPCAPSKKWWIFMFAVHAFSLEASAVFTSLQGITTLLSEQRQRLEGLVDTYCRMSGMKGPLEPALDAIVMARPAEVCGSFVLSHESAIAYMEGLGVWVVEELYKLKADDLVGLAKSVALLFVQAADGISRIIPQRDQGNAASADEMPPVLPYQLMKTDMRQLAKLLQLHHRRLHKFFSAQEIDEISQDFVRFKKECRENPQFQAFIVNSEEQRLGFNDSWLPTNDRFPKLLEFCGGLASAFPNTATVESDFSVIGWEKNDSRRALTDFSLEGILHCKQFQALNSLAGSI